MLHYIKIVYVCKDEFLVLHLGIASCRDFFILVKYFHWGFLSPKVVETTVVSLYFIKSSNF